MDYWDYGSMKTLELSRDCVREQVSDVFPHSEGFALSCSLALDC